MTNNQSAVQNNQTIKGGVTMTNKAFGFQLIQSKEVVVASDRSKVTFPVQVRMTLEVSGKQQNIAYGYSRLGGKQPYVIAAGKAPVAISRKDFMARLRQFNIVNIHQVEKELAKIRFFAKDDFIVSVCECCGKNYVTAANVDFVQRETNRARLSEALGREVTEFSRICYACQGRGPKATAPAPKPAPAPQPQVNPTVVPATSEHATCAQCGKEVKSQKVVEYSLRTYGKVLCYKPCQGKHPKLENAAPKPQTSAPAPKPEVKEPATHGAPASQAPVPTPSVQEEEVQETPWYAAMDAQLVHELMALEVDRYSAIGQLQCDLREMYYAQVQEQNQAWLNLHCEHQEQAHARSASEASANLQSEQEAKGADDLCIICDTVLPSVKEWNYEVCPSCVVRDSELDDANPLKLVVDDQYVAEAKAYLSGASEASAMAEDLGVVEGEVALPLQEEASGDSVVSSEDAQEEPHAQQEEVTVCKSPEPEAGSNVTSVNEYREAVMDFMEAAVHGYNDSDVPPMPQDGQLPW